MKKKTYIAVSVLSDGPCAGMNSIILFTAIVATAGLEKRFTASLSPIADHYRPEILEGLNLTREEQMQYPAPKGQIQLFWNWLKAAGPNPILLSNNVPHDYPFLNYYLRFFMGDSPIIDTVSLRDVWAGRTNSMPKGLGWALLGGKIQGGMTEAMAYKIANAWLEMGHRGMEQ